MFRYFVPFMPLLLLSMLLAALINAADLVRPMIIEYVINRFVSGDGVLSIYVLAFGFFGVVFFGQCCSFAHAWFLNTMGQRIIHNIRMDVFSHIQHMPFRFFDRNASGTILTRATNDVEALSGFYTDVVVALFKDVIMLAGLAAIMLIRSPKLAGVSFSIIPLIILITIWYNKKAKENFRWVRRLTGQINAFFAENISGMRLVQLFSREKEKYGEFKGINDEYNRASVLGVRLNAFFRPVAEFINNIAITLLIWVCARDVINGITDVGTLYLFIDYSKRFFNPINDLADKYGTIQSGSVSAERIFELLDDDEGYEVLERGTRAENILGKIEFRNVWFAYIDEEWVLRDVSFVINPGETAAFVGATGSGKTTVINLICRFYKIQKGEILIDGINIEEYSAESLRANIGVVMQDVFMFSGDINSNIRLNNDNISDLEIVEAAKYVNAHPFIQKLPHGYKEPVKERGLTLSSGERQLLSFARAVAFKPKIMVLDEATANIDTENELIIQSSLEKISKGRTNIVIAHRLSTIKNANTIIVLHKGKIRETGTHEELLGMNGIYKRLYELITT
jgi:ATP-binding cassette subfamily B protein